MKIVDEMPIEGQFIKVWKYNGDLWCDTLMWDGDTLLYMLLAGKKVG